MAQGHVLVLVDDGRDDVGAAAGAVAEEHEADAEALDGRTEDARHRDVVRDHLGQAAARIDIDKHARIVRGKVNHHLLHRAEEEGEHEDGVDGLHAEAPAQHPHGYDEQDDVYQEEGVLHGKARGVENHGARTGQAARGDFVGQLEAGEAHGVEEEAEGDDNVVANVLQEGNLEGHECSFME